MNRLLSILAISALPAMGQWYAPAYPWTKVTQFTYSNLPTLGAWRRIGPLVTDSGGDFATWTNQLFPVYNFWDGASFTTNGWTSNSTTMQARDVWQRDAYSAMWDRLLPASASNASLARFYQAPYPQENYRAQVRVKEWLESNVTAFVCQTNATGTDLSGWFAIETNATMPLMWNATNILQHLGMPTNWWDYTPVSPRVHLGYETSIVYRVGGTSTNPAQVFTNLVVDPWGPRRAPPVHTNSIAGTNGQLVTVLWTNGPVLSGYTSDDYVTWRYARQMFTTLVWTVSGVQPFCPLHDEVGAGSRAWASSVSPDVAGHVGFGSMGASNCAASCADAESAFTFASQPDCDVSIWPYAFRTNSTGLSEAHVFTQLSDEPCPGGPWYGYDIACGSCENIVSSPGCARPLLNLTNCAVIGQCTPTEPMFAVNIYECDSPVREVWQEVVSVFIQTNCQGEILSERTNIWYSNCGGTTNFTTYCTDTVSQVCITAERVNRAMLYSTSYHWFPRTYLDGTNYISDSTNFNPLWQYAPTGISAAVDVYLKFYANPGEEYQAENDAGSPTDGLAKFATITNQVMVTNTFPMIQMGKSGVIALPTFTGNNAIPYAGWCDTGTQRAWRVKSYGCAVSRWTFNW